MGGQHGHPTPPVFRVETAGGGEEHPRGGVASGLGWTQMATPALRVWAVAPGAPPNTSPASAYPQGKGPGRVKRGGFWQPRPLKQTPSRESQLWGVHVSVMNVSGGDGARPGTVQKKPVQEQW